MDQLAVGHRIGGFTLTEPVTRSRSGQVWRAERDEQPGDAVAIEIFDRPEEAPLTASRLAAATSIAGMARLVDQGPGWVATRWVDGRTLGEVVQSEGPLSIDRACRLVEQVATAVDELHAAGVVHGDLNPSNAIVDRDDRVILVGLALHTAPRYTAPEVAAGDRVEAASDRYALALITYEAMSGRSPFPEVTDSTAMLAHHVSSRPTPISEAAPHLGTRFDTLFERALSKTPAARHRNAKDFVAELRSPLAPAEIGGDMSRRWKLVTFALLAIAAAVIAAVFVINRQRSSTAADEIAAATPTEVPTPLPTVTPTATPVVLPPSPAWSSGMAAGFSCNLLAQPGFEQERLPDNWYQGDKLNAISLLAGTGVDNSTAMRVGAGALYGLFAERVPVTGGERYHFSAWVQRQGDPANSGMWIEFVDGDFEQISGIEPELFSPLDGLLNRQGRRVTRFFDAPSNAAWAVPTFFKDASTGSILVDEVVFGPAAACADVPT